MESPFHNYVEQHWDEYVEKYLDERMLTTDLVEALKDKLRRCVVEFCVYRHPIEKAERWLAQPPCLPYVPVCNDIGALIMVRNPFFERCEALVGIRERVNGFGKGWRQTLDVVQIMSIVAAAATCVIAFSALVNLFITLKRK